MSMQIDESYQSKKEEKEQRKEQERQGMKQARFMRMLKNYTIAIVIISAFIYGIYFLAKITGPKGEDFSREVTEMGASHISVGSTLPKYTSNPPTSGPHYVQTAQSGFRRRSVTDQNIIHNLEHGDVWISYRPDISDSMKEELRQFASAKVIITPREANDTDIALASWGRLDAFNIEGDSLPLERIKDFVKRYVGKGPEQVPGASGGV